MEDNKSQSSGRKGKKKIKIEILTLENFDDTSRK